MINETVRVRFAPSPTGYLHVGGLRTALYNYLFARKSKGTFILRIEDTDRNRIVEGAVDNLIAALKWSGLIFDEGVGVGGEYGPYIQSERLSIYKEYVEKLVADKKAYHCFCNDERLSFIREQMKAKGEQPGYDKQCLRLSQLEIDKKLLSGAPFVIRLNVHRGEKVVVKDEIRGLVEFSTDVIDDQVLLKSDGYPTYHLANVVDDHLMRITHVIRGEEWLPSTPKHVLLYKYFGWEVPVFAHLPLLLNADRSKLSKRQGDVAVEDYKSKGYLKDALVNFVAMLGWNPGDEREVFTIDELISEFTFEKVNKAGAVFNVEKLDWLNQQHIMKKPVGELLPALKEELSISNFRELEFSDKYLLTVIDAMHERTIFVKDIVTNAPYFFIAPATYDETGIKKSWNLEAKNRVLELANAFEKLDDDSHDSFEIALRAKATEFGVGAGKLIHPVRLAVSGVSGGPGLFDILSILGRVESVNRMRVAAERIGF